MRHTLAAADASAVRTPTGKSLAASSARTNARARILVQALWDKLPALRKSFRALSAAVETEFLVEAPPQPLEVDEWVRFLARWQYDQDQLQVVADCLAEVEAAAKKQSSDE